MKRLQQSSSSLSLFFTVALVVVGRLHQVTATPVTKHSPVDDSADAQGVPCAESYGPLCSCSMVETGQVSVTCDVRSTDDYDTIRSAFRSSTIDEHSIVSFRLLSKEAVPVPSDALADQEASIISFDCGDNSVPLGAVDANAFTASAERLSKLRIKNCDLTNFDFGFLRPFKSLNEISIDRSTLPSLKSVPSLPRLFSVSITNSNDFRQWYPATSQTPLLKNIVISHNADLDDEKVDAIFKSMGDNVNSIEFVQLRANQLIRVPAAVLALPSLNALLMEFNPVRKLSSGSLKFASDKLEFLFLNNMQLETIEPDAFQGNFADTNVVLSSNKMSSFPSLFEPLLRSMVGHEGNVDVSENPIKDDCNLAWLVAENPTLLPKVSGQTEDGKQFSELNAALFRNRCSL